MPDIIGDPAFVCLGLASAEDGLILISLRLRFLSCCGVTGNSLFHGSAVKYVENISHSFTRATDVYSADVVSIKQGFYCTTLLTKFFVDINEV